MFIIHCLFIRYNFYYWKIWEILLSLYPRCVIWDPVNVIYVLTSELPLKHCLCYSWFAECLHFVMHSTVWNFHFLCSSTFWVCFKVLIVPFLQHVGLLNSLLILCDVKVSIFLKIRTASWVHALTVLAPNRDMQIVFIKLNS